jgi:small-conductance mechanosensitive channel
MSTWDPERQGEAGARCGPGRGPAIQEHEGARGPCGIPGREVAATDRVVASRAGMRRFFQARRIMAIFALFAFALSLLAGPLAFAQAPPPQPVDAGTLSRVLTPATVPSGIGAPPPAAVSRLARASAEVRVRDKVVFVFRAGRAGREPHDRARAANAAVEALLAHPEHLGDTHHEQVEGTAVVYVGETPILTLGPEDVEASGEASLAVLAAQVTSRFNDAISAERKRSVIATTVFNVSLLVFSALIAFLVLGRLSDVAARLRAQVAENPERVTGVRLGKIEFVSAGAARGALAIAFALGFRVTQIALVYGWLIFALSLFEATHGYTERLTGMVLAPLSALTARIAGALPLVVIAAIGIFAVSVLVRFVGLFFDSVARGDTRIAWLSRDLARPTSILVRLGVVVVALVLASPIITGEEDGALTRAGLVALVSLSLAATPVLASAAVGVSVLFGRRLRKGEHVEIGGRAGRLVDASLLEVRLEDPLGCEIRVPHLLGLFHATRVHGHAPIATVEVVVDPSAPQDTVERALVEAARQLSPRGRAELVYLDDAGAHWRVTSASRGPEDLTLPRAVTGALERAGLALGRGGGVAPKRERP